MDAELNEHAQAIHAMVVAQRDKATAERDHARKERDEAADILRELLEVKTSGTFDSTAWLAAWDRARSWAARREAGDG